MKATGRTAKLETLFSTLAETERGSKEYRELVDKIRLSLDDPRTPTNFTVLSEEYPPISDAYAVYDALESVSNGMYDPEALDGIGNIDESSPLYYWQRLVYALIAFYQGDRDNMFQLLEEIPEAYPPSELKGVLYELSGSRSTAELDEEQRELIRKVEEDNSFIHSAVEQLEEYLEAGMEEPFSETAILLIRDLAFKHSEAAKRLALSCITMVGEDSLSIFVEQLQLVFGESEGNRLIALALKEESPDLSILFWIRLTLRSLREEDISLETTRAYLSIVGDLAGRLLHELPEEEPEEEEHSGYYEGLSHLTRKLEDELQRHFNLYEQSSVDTFAEPLRRLSEFAIEVEQKRRVSSGPTDTSARKKSPVQLELF